MRGYAVLVWLVSVVTGERSPLFFAFGDWGESSRSMDQVISQMRAQQRPPFVALLGDSFYPKGVRSVDDDQFRLFDSFSDTSDYFLIALGNHDYGYSESVPSLIAYSRINPKWILPSEYYMKTIDLQNGFGLCLFVLDTHVFERQQQDWLERSLRSCQGPNMYRMILTHYPLLTVGIYARSATVDRLKARIMPLIERYGVHAYISGHEHQMQALELNGVHYIVSGATAQLNRRTSVDTSRLTNELRFVDEKHAAFAIFYLDSEDGTYLSYEFVKAVDGKVLYASQIPITQRLPPPPVVRPAVENVVSKNKHKSETKPESTKIPEKQIVNSIPRTTIKEENVHTIPQTASVTTTPSPERVVFSDKSVQPVSLMAGLLVTLVALNAM